jgi:hypothetical protein
LGKNEIAEALQRVNVNIHCAGSQLFTIFEMIKVLVGRFTGETCTGDFHSQS